MASLAREDASRYLGTPRKERRRHEQGRPDPTSCGGPGLRDGAAAVREVGLPCQGSVESSEGHLRRIL